MFHAATTADNSEGQIKVGMCKMGTPVYHKVDSTMNMFTVSATKGSMDKLFKAKKAQETYMEKVEREGDIHYFKKQFFHPGYNGTVTYLFYSFL